MMILWSPEKPEARRVGNHSLMAIDCVVQSVSYMVYVYWKLLCPKTASVASYK